MAQHGTWVSYSGSARLVLAAVLLAVAAAVAYAGVRLRLPAGPARPRRRRTVALMLTAWALAIAAFLTAFALYAEQALRDHLLHGLPPDYIFPVTLIAAGATFLIVAVTGQPSGRTALAGAAIAAMSGPMIFELPFDLIVMTRTYPPIPPHPDLYRAMFFVPLFLVEILTLSLLTLSPMARLTRSAFVCFALLLAVFAGWALTGFGYPLAPVPIAFNMVSKLLAFATVVALFVPGGLKPEQRARQPGQTLKGG